MEEKIEEILENKTIRAEYKDHFFDMLRIGNQREVIICLKEIFDRKIQEMIQYGVERIVSVDVALINNILESMNILITDYSKYLSKEDMVLVDNALCTINYNFSSLLLKYDNFNNIVKELTFSLLRDERLSSVEALDEERASLSTNFKPLSLEDLQEGDYFGVCAYDLLPVVLYNDDAAFRFIVPSTINYSGFLKDSILLFKYLGDNKCVEFYTGYEVELGISRKKTYTHKEKDKYLFGKDFNRVRYSPLCIYKESCRKKLYAFDDEFKERFISQQGEKKEKIKSVITVMAENNRILMAERINRLVEADYEVATKEYDFELSLAKFESEIAAKKELKKTIKEDKLENYSFEAGV